MDASSDGGLAGAGMGLPQKVDELFMSSVGLTEIAARLGEIGNRPRPRLLKPLVDYLPL